jgi:hypothetical protein
MNLVIRFSRMACGGGNDGCEGDSGKEVVGEVSIGQFFQDVSVVHGVGARPQCQPRQGQLALLNPQCPYQTQAPLPCNLNESGD